MPTATIPANVIFLWTGTNASIPAGWSRETTLDAKYPKGTAAATDPGTTGGALTHSHTSQNHTHTGNHTHTLPDSGAGSGTTARDTGSIRPPDTHTHVSNPSTTNPATSLTNANPSTDAINNEPAFFTVIHIKSDGTPTGVPVNAVGIWNTSTAPTGWNLCDGGASRPDMRGAFLKGAAAAGDGGGTGGAATHSHTLASHDHGTNFSHSHPNVTSSQTAVAMVGGNISGSQAATATRTHTHDLTINNQATDTITGSTDATGTGANEPPYCLQGYIQNNNAGADIPLGIIGLWVGTLANIPNGWALCDGTANTPDLRSTYVKGATTLGGIGTTGGSTTHTHTPTGHTHAVAAHTHTVTAATGAGSNETAGAVNCATTAHTHPSWSPTGSSSFTSGSTTPTVDNFTTTEPPFSTVAFIQFQMPFVLTEATVPQPKRTIVQPQDNVNLLNTLLAPSAALPFSGDVSLPQQRRQQPRQLIVRPLGPPVSNLPRSPLFNRPDQKRPTPLFDPPNLQALLTPTAQNPFAQYDWPTPQRRAQAPSFDAVNLLNSLYAVTQNPFVPGDQPNPQSRRTPQQRDIYTNLLLTTLAVPIGQQTWPNPQQKKQYQADLFENLLTSTLFRPPFAQTDWPNPQRTVRAQQDLFTNLLLTTLAVPIGQQAWPNPQQIRAVGDLTWLLNLLQSTLTPAAAAPFFNIDWPVPRGRSQNDLSWAVNLLQSTLRPVAGTPFTNFDFRMPQPKPIDQSIFQIAVSPFPPPTPTPTSGAEYIIFARHKGRR